MAKANPPSLISCCVLSTLLLLSASALVISTPLQAQVLYGSLVGNVRDQTGAAIPGADVVVINQQTNRTRQTITNETGGYGFNTLRSGDLYTLQVNMPGFKEFKRTDIPVTLNTVTRVDITLQLGEVTETVTVRSETAILQTDRAEVRAEVTEEKLVNLPVPLGRNYQHLMKTLPGFNPPQEVHSIQTNPSRSLRFGVNGVSSSINNTRIDGATSADPWLPHITAYVPSLEAIQTVNVVTNSFDAEQGLAGGAAINVQLKSGTNDFHGALFGYHHNHHLRAKNFFFPADRNKGKFIFNQWGAAAGGPIQSDKLFYFVSYEGTHDGRNASRIGSVPTEAVRRGDFSGFSARIYDPLTGNPDGSGRQAFPNNQIPEDRQDEIVRKVISQMPLPNLLDSDGSVPEANNYFATGASVFKRWTIDSKVDWNAGDNLNFFGRFSVLDYSTLQPTLFGEKLVGQALTPFGGGGGNAGTGAGNTYNFSVGVNSILSPVFIVDANFGFVRFITDSRNVGYGENIGLDFLGIPGTNGPEPWQGGWPRFDISGYSPFGVNEAFMPYLRRNDQYQYVTNFTWTKQTHEVRWGLDLYNQHMNHSAEPELAGIGGRSTGPRGRFTFGTGPTRLCEKPDGAGGCSRLSSSTSQVNAFASFLLGLPTTVGKTLVTEVPRRTRNWGYSFYIRDRWQISRKLTLSYGTRWEYFPLPTRGNRGVERYDWETNQMLVGGFGSIPKDLGVKMSKTLFAPRLGIAYRATDTWVIRAGYGITNDPYPLSRSLLQNYPAVVELAIDGPDSWTPVRPLAEGIPTIPVPDFSDGIIDIPPEIGAATINTEFKRGYVQSWNLTVQKKLKWDLVGEVGYVATRQVRQLGLRELNWAPVGSGRAGQQLFQKFGRTARARLVAPVGGSHYDSLQARLQRRFSNGLSLDAAYTWSKSIASSGLDNSDNTLRISIPEFYHLNRSLSGFDRTHNLEITQIWELPFGAGRRWLSQAGGFINAIVSGWQVNSILSFYSGTPFSISASGASLNAPESSQRADQVKSKVEILGGTGRGQPYFDPLAFAPVNEPRFGTAGFNSLRGPGVATWDFGLFRNFQASEEVNIQFRMEAFNFTNTPQFGNPRNNVSNSGFGEITSARAERIIRFGLRIGF